MGSLRSFFSFSAMFTMRFSLCTVSSFTMSLRSTVAYTVSFSCSVCLNAFTVCLCMRTMAFAVSSSFWHMRRHVN